MKHATSTIEQTGKIYTHSILKMKKKKPLSLRKVIKELFNITLYNYQQDFLYDCINNQRIVGVFCRQTGKSMTIAMVAVIEAIKNPGSHIVIVAPTDRQAGELFKKIADFVKDSPVSSEVSSVTMRQMVIKNSRISAFPCGDSGDTIRGMTANVLIMEEAAYIKDSIVNQVLMPMVAATQGKVIKISTPFSMNHFYNSFQSDDAYKSHHYTWQHAVDAKHFTMDFIDEQKMQLGEHSIEFRTEYCAEFIPDEDAFFSWELIDKCVSDYEMLGEI